MISFNRFGKQPWIDIVLSADQRAAAYDDLRWLSLSRSNLRAVSADSDICHLTLSHDRAEDDVALPTLADDGRWA